MSHQSSDHFLFSLKISSCARDYFCACFPKFRVAADASGHICTVAKQWCRKPLSNSTFGRVAAATFQIFGIFGKKGQNKNIWSWPCGAWRLRATSPPRAQVGKAPHKPFVLPSLNPKPYTYIYTYLSTHMLYLYIIYLGVHPNSYI